MVRRGWLLAGSVCVALAVQTAGALAGAWPRGEGNTFVTLSRHVTAQSVAGPFQNYTALYLEYGLNDRLTLGLDLGHGVSGKSKAVAFLRGPLADWGDRGRLGWEIGAGRIAGRAVIRPGLSYGIGLGDGAGWFAVDVLGEVSARTGRIDAKADVTLGINHSDRLRAILQLQTGKSEGDPAFARIAPSLVVTVRRNTHIELGATAELRGLRAYGLKIGLWKEF